MNVKELFNKVTDEEIFDALVNHHYILDRVEIKDKEKSRIALQNFYRIARQEIINLDIEACNDGIICVRKCIDESDETKELYILDMYETKDLKVYYENGEELPVPYGIEFGDWKEIAGLQVANISIEKYGKEIVAATILQEMTFFGCYYEKTRNEQTSRMEELDESMKEIEEGKTKTYSAEEFFTELFEKYGFEYHEPTEEERKLEYERTKRIIDENMQRKRNMLAYLRTELELD